MRLHLLLLLLMLAAGLPGRTALAQVVAPTQGGEVSAVRISDTTMELSFGTTGNGQGRVVAIALSNWGAPVPLAAEDGKFYTGSTTYGQGSTLGKGYVIYNGTGNSVTVTGLQPDTFYYVTDSEYNTDGSTIAYNTNGISMATNTSSAPQALAPDPTPLPVKLTVFKGSVDASNMATLHWATASERNTAYFAIERSADGIIFTEAGRVAAATTSNETLVYQWSDPQRLVSSTYYRLRQADKNGEVNYSGVVTLVPIRQLTQSIEIYPNPSAGQAVQLLLQGYNGESFNLHLADALGRTVLSQTITSVTTQYLLPLPLPQGLAPGTYLLTLSGSSTPIQKRIIVSN
jgi:hypothetical protein